MSIFDKMFGHEEKPKEAPQQQAPQPPPPPQGGYGPPQGAYGQGGYPPPPQQGGYAPPPPMTDQQAIARYQYMLKTAPPETIEQAHQEAFAQLTPQQRAMVLQQLTAAAPPAERQAMYAPGADDPQNLARMATRAEVRQPGTMERIFGSSSAGTGPSMGAVVGGSLLTSLAGGFIGSAIADHFFNNTQAGRGFFGMGGPGFGGGFGGGYGGGFGGGYGGPQIINETNYYGGGQGGRGGRDNEVSDNADDGNYDTAADDQVSDNQAADDDSANQYDDQVDDQSSDTSYDDSSDNSSSDDGGGYDDSGN